MEPQRLQKDNEQCVASEHVTVSLSVAVENANGRQVGPTLLMWRAKELLDQEGRGSIVKSETQFGEDPGKEQGRCSAKSYKVKETEPGKCYHFWQTELR